MRKTKLIKFISQLLVICIIVGLLPVKKVKADTVKGQSDEISVTYHEQSSWGDFTQAQVDVTNITDEAIEEWNVSLTFDKSVQVSSIWNAVLCETDISSENVLYITNESYNGHIEAGSTVSFGLITESEANNLPEVKIIENNSEIPSEEETDLFSCAVFAENDFNFNGWKSTIAGDFYTGSDFNYQGSELYLYGSLDVVNSINASGWKMEIGETNEKCDAQDMPDFAEGIYSLREELEEIDNACLVSADSIVTNGFYYKDGNVDISGTTFEGDCVIVATGDITYNVDTLSGSGRVVLYSENGNITINGSEITVNGILYAPNGNININAYNTTFNGRIIANNVNYQGSIFNVTAVESDLELLYVYPEIDITASSSEVYQGENAYFEVSLEEDEETPYVVKYRLNGEEVEIDETLVYVLDTILLGSYKLEAYIEISTGEKVLDSDVICVKEIVTPEPTATSTPVPTMTVIPTEEPTSEPTPTVEPTEEPTPTVEPTVELTEEPTPTAVPTSIVEPTATVVPTIEPTTVPTVEPTEEPTPTVIPTAIPTEEPVEYSVISEGDPTYGYVNIFQENNWNCGNDASFNPYCIEVCPNITWKNGYAFYMTSRVFDEDLSFDARYTTRIDYTSSRADGIAFVISPRIVNENTNGGSIGYGNIEPSIVVELDNWSNGGKHLNELGEGDWISGENSQHIGITLDGVTTVHYAYADYAPIKTSGAIHEVWVSYDGKEKVMYVYIAQYDADGNVEKPETPTLVYHIDLEEHFAGVNDLYMGFTSASGIACGSHNLLGFELDPMPSLHGNGTIQIMSQIGEVAIGGPIVINGKINGSDSKVQLLDAGYNEIYSEDLHPSGNYEKLTEISTEGLSAGDYYVIISAIDAEGNNINQAIYVKLVEEIVTPTPTNEVTPTPVVDEFTDDELYVSIEDDQDGMEIPFIADINGTVSGSLLSTYTFEIISTENNAVVYSVTGTEEVIEAALGTVDATVLCNGYYTVRVTAYTEDGEGIFDDIIVLISGSAKIGNYNISFLDISTGLNNFPIEVYRTYDSRNLYEEGDFGYGWDMRISGPTISISTSLSDNWRQDTKAALVAGSTYYWAENKPHEVTIDWGNGKTETFVLKLTPDNQSYIAITEGISAQFEASGNETSTFEILDEHENLWYLEDVLLTSNLEVFNPQNFLLTTRDGVKYYFNVDRGLYKVEDTYGRTIEIADNGILYSDGTGLTINRDEVGRVTSITDGTQTVSYTYDENGDLVSVTERTGDIVKLSYTDHYLNDIVDSRGVHVARNEYDDDGRLIATIDADGNRIEFSHDLGDRTEVVTNRLGYSTIYVYDEYGNIISETDALGRTTTRTYDENNQLASETDAMGNTTYYSYTANGDLVSLSDSHGRTVENTYSSNGELLTMNQCGVTQLELFYDVHGNITEAEDALGNEQSYVYTAEGNLSSVSDSIGTVINCTYDDEGNVTSVISANGSSTSFTYDSLGRATSRSTTYNGNTLTDRYTYDIYDNVTEIIYADGTTESFVYDSMGNCTSEIDSLGNTILYGYDIYGNLISIAYPDGTTESFTYDVEGQQLSATDRLGLTTTYTYDAVGNMLTATTSTGVVTTYTYDNCDRVLSVDNSCAGTTSYEYDYLGRNTKVTDSLGNATEYVYNDFGLVSSVIDANGNSYSFTYDAGGNQTSVTYPNGSTYSSGYDVRSRLISESDAEGNTIIYAYDSMDRLISVVDSSGATWSYEYDSIGNITKVTDSLGNSTTYSYDEYGRLIATMNADGNVAEVFYNEYGQVVRRTDFGGNATTYTYDSYGRTTSESVAEGTVRYYYNNLGQLIKVQDIEGDIYYTYSSEGYISSKTDEQGNVITYSYNELGYITEEEYGDKSILYTYDVLGRITEVEDQDGNITSYSYDRVGNLIETKYSNGITTTYSYNEVNLLVLQVTTDSEGNIIASYKYTLGSNGERLKIEELTRTIEYTYDSCERLTSEIITYADGKTTVTSYTYDSNSNRLTKTVDGDTTKYEYNELNQLIAEDDIIYTYDDAGNLVSSSTGDILLSSYKYNSRNQMIESIVYTVEGTLTVEYTYNYLGDRITKTVDGVTTYYTLDYSSGLSQVIEETTNSKTVFYVRGLELISREETSGTYFYILDGGNTVRALVDEEGNVTDKYIFDSFGNETSHDGDSANSYGFQGEQLDDETGLYYLRARYMNPTTGTFTSMDTYGGTLSDPTSLHKYLFANSNPVKYCDPTGHDAKAGAADFTLSGMETVVGIMVILSTFTLMSFNNIGFLKPEENKGCVFSIQIQKAISGITYVQYYQLTLSLIVLMASASREIGKRMDEAFEKGQRGGKKRPNFKHAAHHIVPFLMQKAQEARDVMEKFHIDLNDPVNGVFLPTEKGVSSACYHPSVHTTDYVQYLIDKLNACDSAEEVIEFLEQMAENLVNGYMPWL